MARVSLCIDVSDLPLATTFYCDAIGCLLKKVHESHNTLSSDGVTLQLLLRAEGTNANSAPGCIRAYERHWTPVHLDFEVSDIDEAMARVERHRGVVEEVKRGDWGAAAYCVGPFGNGFCLLAIRS